MTGIDLQEMKMTFSNAAHWPMYIHNKENNNLRELTVRGKPIGLNRDEKYKNITIDIKKNERLVFFTDRVVEERDINNTQINEVTLERIIKENSQMAPELLIDTIFNSIYKYSKNYRKSGLEDDATMVVVDII